MSGTSFASLAHQVLDSWLAAHPSEATYLGDHRYDHLLEDPSRDSSQRRAAEIRAHLGALDEAVIGEQDSQIDAAVMLTTLRAELLELELLDEAGWNPMLHNPGQGLYQLSFPFAPAGDRLDAVIARLAAMPDYLHAARERLADMSRVHVETAARQFDGTVTLIETVVPALATEAGSPHRADAAAHAASKAVLEHRAWLALQLEQSERDPRLGSELFAAKLRLTLDTDFDPMQLKRRAEDDLERITAEIIDAAERLSGGSTAGIDAVRTGLDRLAQDVATDDTILAYCRSAFAETTAFVRERELVTVFDDPVEIIEMPEIDRGIAGAYCRPVGPLETAALATQFAVSPTPKDWTPEQAVSFFREYNLHMLHNLTVHEAMPGHALQLMHSNRNHAATPVRAVFGSGSFIEGWAVYAEALMAAHGYRGDISPEAAAALHMQQLKMQLRTTLNTILDVGFHCGDLDEAGALALMHERGYQERSEALEKWRRVQLTSTQLCTYYVGYVEVRELAGDVRRAHPRWSERQVHDAMLAHGSPPVRHVRTLLGLEAG